MLENAPLLLSFLCYGFLYLGIFSLWIPSKRKFPLWSIFFSLSLIFGLIGNYIEIYALAPLLALGFFLYYGKDSTLTLKSVLYTFGSIVVCIGLFLHIIPGFHNLHVLQNILISPDAIPYSLYLNLDKTSAGILILGLTYPLIETSRDWSRMLKTIIFPTLIIIGVVAGLSLLMGYVRFDPKLPDTLWIWIPTNLLFVCLAEEAFFRGFIQRKLTTYFANIKFGPWYSILIAAFLFGLAHYIGGIQYILLATFAGIGYGWIYHKTNHIEASILMHFCVNLVHILLFTYPALKTAF